MAANNAKALDTGIRHLIIPAMDNCNFSYDSPSRTFRRPLGECIQIVDFQIGIRPMKGKFTVNLAIFHPKYRERAARDIPPPDIPMELDCLIEFRRRLSTLRDTPITKYFRKRIQSADSFLKWWLVTPTDEWWSLSSDSAQVAAELGLVNELLLSRGLDWLDKNSDVALLKRAHEKFPLVGKNTS